MTHEANRRAIALLAGSDVAAQMPDGWLDMWLDAIPATIPYKAIQSAAAYAARRQGMPSLAEFIAICEDARDGLPIGPHLSREEENAQIILNMLSGRHLEMDVDTLRDALLIGAAVLYAGQVRRSGIPLTSDLIAVDFAGRARMFGDAAIQWAEDADAGSGAWQAFFSRSRHS